MPNKIMLMIPGPSEPDPEVLSSLSLPVIPHYGAKWSELYQRTIGQLQKVFRTDNEVILIPSPGQATVEMAVSNLVAKDEEAFVCSNGFFSETISEAIKFHGGKPIPIKAEYGKPVTAENVRAAVEESKSKKERCLFLVHNETSTGVTSPAEDVMRVCREKGLISVLDSISAFGGINIEVDKWKVDCCIGYPSKALGGVFGITPMSLSKECWNVAKKNSESIHNRFFNLNVWRYYIDEWSSWGHPHPSTMPTNIVVALDKALELALNEGLDKRYARHDESAKMMREGLESIGLSVLPEERWASSTVTAANVDAKSDELLRTQLIQKYGIMIAGGLGQLRGRIIRIGTMGSSATASAVSITLAAMEKILKTGSSGSI